MTRNIVLAVCAALAMATSMTIVRPTEARAGGVILIHDDDDDSYGGDDYHSHYHHQHCHLEYRRVRSYHWHRGPYGYHYGPHGYEYRRVQVCNNDYDNDY